MALGSRGSPGRDTWAGAGGPVFLASHPGQDAHPWALLPHPDPPPPPWTSALASSHSALPARDHPASIPACVSGIACEKNLDLTIWFFFFFLLDITINSPQPSAWHSRPPQSSPAYLPSLITLPSALTLHCLGAVLRVHPDPCTVHSLIFLPGTPSLPSSLVTRESLLPRCLLWEAVPDCTQGEVGTALSRHPLIYNKGQGREALSVLAPTYCTVFNKSQTSAHD